MIRDVNVHIYAFGGEFYNHVTYASLEHIFVNNVNLRNYFKIKTISTSTSGLVVE